MKCTQEVRGEGADGYITLEECGGEMEAKAIVPTLDFKGKEVVLASFDRLEFKRLLQCPVCKSILLV